MVLTEPHYKVLSAYTAITQVREYRSEYVEGRHRLRLLKRFPPKEHMDLKVDYAFKQFFGKDLFEIPSYLNRI